MSDFRQLSDRVWASPQLIGSDIRDAAAEGFTLLINNRPEGEEPNQLPGGEAAAIAAETGMDYVAIPVTPGGFTQAQVQAMAEALAKATGPVLAYCRSGTRSTFLWALAEAAGGGDPSTLVESAAQAGYDIGAIRPTLDALSAQAED
ncbi:TIGR01244 family phosphatase [Altererythrobacter xixiisoli]|uniref:TIGR01244 family phosphatase n=1 Tax=Croceibacterium xixiisoli TaxID=1476466 RepID=A0A6I4TYG4_9SPHN|nr:TIGR01244 family sulfur transferase [Croceibacterium xixiisoli]MXP00140.1 TIGR01244 family phosphatase [Croceibacterium xixiisoli]